MSEKQVPTKTRPFSIRLTEAELACIKAKAGATPLPKYVRGILLGESAIARRSRQTPLQDQKLLAQILARLGTYGRGPSLTRLAYLAERGAFYCDDETLGQLRLACQDVTTIRNLLMQALGKETDPDPSDAFNDAAGRASR